MIFKDKLKLICVEFVSFSWKTWSIALWPRPIPYFDSYKRTKER